MITSDTNFSGTEDLYNEKRNFDVHVSNVKEFKIAVESNIVERDGKSDREVDKMEIMDNRNHQMMTNTIKIPLDDLIEKTFKENVG